LSKTPSLKIGGLGLIILFADAKKSSVLKITFEPSLGSAN